MPVACADRPRKIFPAPMTSATCRPLLCALRNFARYARDRFRIDAVILISHQGFAGNLQQNALILVIRHISSMVRSVPEPYRSDVGGLRGSIAATHYIQAARTKKPTPDVSGMGQ